MCAKLAGKCILVVEDNAMLSFRLADLLTSCGAVVAGPFASCKEALDYLANGRPDVAVLDIELIDGRSYPIAGRLRELDIGFVVTSGQVLPDADLSGAPFFSKPYSDEPLLTALYGLTAG